MKNYIIIGGSSGIGNAVAKKLHAQGNHVTATYFQNEPSDSEGIQYFPFNVLEDDLNMESLPDTLDGIVYCPGSINLKPFTRLKPQSFIDDYKLQVIGAVKILQKVLPLLKSSEQASVVLFSTVAVQQGFNFHSQVSASKGALEGLTRALAAEWAPSIRVNAIAPSLTQTSLSEKLLNTEDKVETNANRHPLKRVGKPEDIAELTVFLLSSSASWITGQIIGVDGGMSSIK